MNVGDSARINPSHFAEFSTIQQKFNFRLQMEGHSTIHGPILVAIDTSIFMSFKSKQAEDWFLNKLFRKIFVEDN